MLSFFDFLMKSKKDSMSCEVHNRAGSGLFFILMTLSYVTFKKLLDQFGGFGVADPGNVTV
jgi:hypothetical protein